jgi:hypothetical protein
MTSIKSRQRKKKKEEKKERKKNPGASLFVRCTNIRVDYVCNSSWVVVGELVTDNWEREAGLRSTRLAAPIPFHGVSTMMCRKP